MLYKTIIRPILTYASPIWANTSLTSSAQMERVRLTERKYLRPITNTRRKRGSYMFANNTILYRNAKTTRIDRFITDKALNFIDQCAESKDPHINAIAKFPHLANPKYLPTAFWSKWRANNTLLDNNRLLIFNQSKRDPHRLVYNTNQ